MSEQTSQNWKAWPARLDKWLRKSVRRTLLDEHLGNLDVEYQGRVLEIGAGRQGRRGDFEPPVEQAKNWFQLDLRATASPHVQADMQRMPIAKQTLDLVICLEVLEYLDNPGLGLREIKRTLKPRGRLVLATPFIHRADSNHDYWRFTEPGLRFLLREAGFEIVRLRAQGAALGAAVNILKYGIHQLDQRRLFWGLLCRPVLNLLWKTDRSFADRFPTLATFSTGYLLIALPR